MGNDYFSLNYFSCSLSDNYIYNKLHHLKVVWRFSMSCFVLCLVRGISIRNIMFIPKVIISFVMSSVSCIHLLLRKCNQYF